MEKIPLTHIMNNKVVKCWHCPFQRYGKCNAATEPEESEEPRNIKDILAKPPKWCPLRKSSITITFK